VDQVDHDPAAGWITTWPALKLYVSRFFPQDVDATWELETKTLGEYAH